MTQPDIVFIVLDTQRADRLGCYGYGRPVSPNLDRFAGNGVLFAQAISPAQWTIPSHASLFTGLYPTAHQVTQSDHSLGPDRPLLAELLAKGGYETVGFCNNPLVGVLNNGLKRGFHTFYNYGGAIPTVPKSGSRLPWPLNQVAEWYTQFLRRISYPIQNFFGRSSLAFSISLNAWLTPLWARFANFKGQNERSVRDVVGFLRRRDSHSPRRPLFLFVNLMETHLPFRPGARFVAEMAPQMGRSLRAQAIMRRWNRESFRWGAPLEQPLDEDEEQLLSDMYDAEVAYQDDYLGPLLHMLEQRENTLTVIVSDHGDGLGDHGYFGHAFVAYQELVHVPLLLHWPGQLPASLRVATPVSTRRLYHTLLEAAGVGPELELAAGVEVEEIRRLSLRHTILGQDPEQATAYAEVYPPLNFVRAVADRFPQLIDRFRCLSLRRAIVRNELKLIQVDGLAPELFDLERDPRELEDRLAQMPAAGQALSRQMQWQVAQLERQQARLAAGATVDLAADERLLQRLRGLGYID